MTIVLKYKSNTRDGIEYLYKVENIDAKEIDNLMKELCQEKKVSIYWELRTKELFISLNFCGANLCTGIINDN